MLAPNSGGLHRRTSEKPTKTQQNLLLRALALEATVVTRARQRGSAPRLSRAANTSMMYTVLEILFLKVAVVRTFIPMITWVSGVTRTCNSSSSITASPGPPLRQLPAKRMPCKADQSRHAVAGSAGS